MSNTTRRKFLKTGAVVVGGAVATRTIKAWPSRAGTKQAAPLSLFGYSQVQLLEGMLRNQFEENHQLFLGLNEDALLKPFRQREGMAAPGPDMGGWYDNSSDFDPEKNFHGFVPGHTFGQYVSALSRAYAITGSKPTQEKVQRLVRAYAATADPSGKFYVGYRLPAYTYDKICCGLIDAHEFAADPIALEVLKRSTKAVLPYLPEKALSRPEMRARPHKDIAYTWDESYTLPENLFLAYQRSGDVMYRELGVRFIEKEYFDPLAEGQNVLPGEHAYSHVNALSSAMQAYLELGDEKYLRAASHGLRMVQEQSYATGGWGPNEEFVEPGKGKLGESLSSTHSSFETPCGAYGHFKVTRYLLRVTQDSRYGDSMERLLYNTIAGAKPIRPDGICFYYSDYNNSGKKEYYRNKWPCCSGTFPQLAADYGISAYYHSPEGIYVNLFLPSRVSWRQINTSCSLIQQTKYPAENTTLLTFTLARPEKFTLYVRIPAWAGANTSVSVNGGRVESAVVPGKFLAIPRTWKTGDRLEMEMEQPLRLEAVDAQNPDLLALVRGPVAMFGVGDIPATVSKAQLLAARAGGSPGDLTVKTDKGEMQMRPFPSIEQETYRLYFKTVS